MGSETRFMQRVADTAEGFAAGVRQGQRDVLAKVIREARKRRDRARREAKDDDHTWLIGHADVADQLHRDIADLSEVAAGRRCECGHYVFARYLGPGNDCEPCRECDCDDYSEVATELRPGKDGEHG